jgi:dipeptidyl aminopeptidase/acylaminoacyl peptidase
MGRPLLVNWLSSDGESLEGILLLPSGFRQGERFPLVVWVYGGVSLSDDFDRFGLGYSGPFNLQLLATRGYAVLLPDTPLNVGTPMLDLAKTVLPAINRVIDMGIVDPDKLGVVGHSYGGYSTVALIVQTNRFNAAVEVDGYGDLIAYYGEMDEDGAAFGISMDEHGQGLMGGSPWEFSDRYIQNSPIFSLRRVKTPLLIVHGSNDTTVAPFLGDELFVALRRLGKEVEYAKYEGEGHSPPYWSFPNQVDLCNRMISWLNLHLRESAAH